MPPRLPPLLLPPVAFAHRGARAHAPENTLEAFELALRLGATGLESDVWLTADGVAVLDHDGVVRSGLRKRAIGDLRREQLPPHIPALADLLVACGTSYHLSIDLKDPGAGPAVVGVVREIAPELLPRLWLCLPDGVAALRGLDPDVKLVESTRLARIKEGPERRVATLAQHGVDALNMHHSDWTGGLVALAHRFGRLALAWDLQVERLLDAALDSGLDAVMSDWVDRMVDSYVRVYGEPPSPPVLVR